MENLKVLDRRIRAAQKLLAVVRAMKTLAALNVRRHEEAVAAIDAYRETVELGLSMLLFHRPALGAKAGHAGGRVGLVVVGSDRGMCGGFNERLVEHVVTHCLGLTGDPGRCAVVLAVGHRAALRLEDAGVPVAARLAGPGSVGGVESVVRAILYEVDGWRAHDRVERVQIAFNRLNARASAEPTLTQVLPPDAAWMARLGRRRWPGRSLPAFTQDPGDLLAALLQEWLFISFQSAVSQSLASENASRMVAMQAAQRSIEERLEGLRRGYQRSRQANITVELLDRAAGLESVAACRAGAGPA